MALKRINKVSSCLISTRLNGWRFLYLYRERHGTKGLEDFGVLLWRVPLRRCGCLAAWEALLVIDAFVALLSSAELVGREAVDTLAQHLDDVCDRWGKSALAFSEVHPVVPGHTSLKWAGSYLAATPSLITCRCSIHDAHSSLTQ